MPQLSQLLQLLKNEKDSWSNTPNLLSLLRSADSEIQIEHNAQSIAEILQKHSASPQQA